MNIFNRKYPFPQSSHWLRDCVVYSAIVVLILYLLQPFGFNQYQGNKLIASVGFGVVTFACCVVFNLVVFLPLSKRVRVWKVWHQGLTVLGMVLLIGICNFFACSYLFHFPFTLHFFGLFLYWTLIIGIIVTICSVGLSYHRYLRGRLETLLNKTTEQQEDIIVAIHDTSVRGNDLQLSINDLLYIEAQKNQVVVCYTKDGAIQKTEVHTTLTAVLDDLQSYDNIFQCHRSFVVNLNNITSAQGNSNGYQLKLGTCPTVVPVSRTYVPKLRSYIA